MRNAIGPAQVAAATLVVAPFGVGTVADPGDPDGGCGFPLDCRLFREDHPLQILSPAHAALGRPITHQGRAGEQCVLIPVSIAAKVAVKDRRADADAGRGDPVGVEVRVLDQREHAVAEAGAGQHCLVDRRDVQINQATAAAGTYPLRVLAQKHRCPAGPDTPALVIVLKDQVGAVDARLGSHTVWPVGNLDRHRHPIEQAGVGHHLTGEWIDVFGPGGGGGSERWGRGGSRHGRIGGKQRGRRQGSAGRRGGGLRHLAPTAAQSARNECHHRQPNRDPNQNSQPLLVLRMIHPGSPPRGIYATRHIIAQARQGTTTLSS